MGLGIGPLETKIPWQAVPSEIATTQLVPLGRTVVGGSGVTDPEVRRLQVP